MSGHFTRILSVFLFLTVVLGGVASAQNLVSFDKFPGPFIDPQKWKGFEEADEDGTNAEAVRQIVNGQLSLQLRSYGDGTSDDGTSDGASGLTIRDPRGISQIAFDAKAPTVILNGCPANSDSTFGGIAGAATFFYDDDDCGDVTAFIYLGRSTSIPTPANRLEVRGEVAGNWCGTIAEVDLGTIAQGATARLSMEWDPNMDEIRFRLNQRPVEVVLVPGAEDSPDDDFKGIAAFGEVENCTAHETSAYTKGTIDNVSIKRLP
jgi:hypothetical protein